MILRLSERINDQPYTNSTTIVIKHIGVFMMYQFCTIIYNIDTLVFTQMWCVALLWAAVAEASRGPNTLGQPEYALTIGMPSDVDSYNHLSPMPFSSGTYHFVSSTFPGRYVYLFIVFVTGLNIIRALISKIIFYYKYFWFMAFRWTYDMRMIMLWIHTNREGFSTQANYVNRSSMVFQLGAYQPTFRFLIRKFFLNLPLFGKNISLRKICYYWIR